VAGAVGAADPYFAGDGVHGQVPLSFVDHAVVVAELCRSADYAAFCFEVVAVQGFCG